MTDQQFGPKETSDDPARDHHVAEHRSGDQRSVAQVKAGLLEWSRTRDLRTNKALAQAGWYVAGGVGVIALVWAATRVVGGAPPPAAIRTTKTPRPSLVESATRQAGRMSLLWRLGTWVFSRHQEQHGISKPAQAHAVPNPPRSRPWSPAGLRTGTLPPAQGRIS